MFRGICPTNIFIASGSGSRCASAFVFDVELDAPPDELLAELRSLAVLVTLSARSSFWFDAAVSVDTDELAVIVFIVDPGGVNEDVVEIDDDGDDVDDWFILLS